MPLPYYIDWLGARQSCRATRQSRFNSIPALDSGYWGVARRRDCSAATIYSHIFDAPPQRSWTLDLAAEIQRATFLAIALCRVTGHSTTVYGVRCASPPPELATPVQSTPNPLDVCLSRPCTSPSRFSHRIPRRMSSPIFCHPSPQPLPAKA